MQQRAFEVGEQVYLMPSKHFGTIVQVRHQKPLHQPEAPDTRCYDIQLDDGAILMRVYRGIEPVPDK